MHQYPDYDMPGVASGPGMMIREEKGYYWCQEHRGYHLTSQKGIRRK